MTRSTHERLDDEPSLTGRPIAVRFDLAFLTDVPDVESLGSGDRSRLSIKSLSIS